MAATATTSTAAQQQQPHPLPNARRRRFVEQEAGSMLEIMKWSPAARPARASTGSNASEAGSHHHGHCYGMKTRSQATAAQEEEAQQAAVERAATALLRKRQAERTAAKVAVSSIALAQQQGGPMQSPWGVNKTLRGQEARRAGGRKKPADGAAVVVAHKSSKSLFPYPHTPGKPVNGTGVEQGAAVQGVTRQLSDTAFAKRYQRPIFGAASPTKESPPFHAAAAAAAVVDGSKAVQPWARQVWPKPPAVAAAGGKTPAGKGSSKKTLAAAAAAAVVGKTAASSKAKRASSKKEEGADACTLASVEAGFRSFVAALEKEEQQQQQQQQQQQGQGGYQQQRRRSARLSSCSSSAAAAAASGNVVVLASTPAKAKGGKTPVQAVAAAGQPLEGEEGFVLVEHADAPPAAVETEAQQQASVNSNAIESASLSLLDEKSEALTALKSLTARRGRRKTRAAAFDEKAESSDEEGAAALKTDPRAYRSWVEKIPPAGTRIVKGLSVGDCLC